MVFTDYITRDLIVQQEAKFNFEDLYDTLKSHLEKLKYTVTEKEYKDIIKEKTNFKIKWKTEKRMSDYIRFKIDIKLKGKNTTTIQTKQGQMTQGTITIEFESYIERDYEDIYTKNPFLSFLRAVYDKFVIRNKMESYQTELKDQTYEVFNLSKNFLKQQRFK